MPSNYIQVFRNLLTHPAFKFNSEQEAVRMIASKVERCSDSGGTDVPSQQWHFSLLQVIFISKENQKKLISYYVQFNALQKGGGSGIGL